ncbi:hypothetical protein J3D55_000843 [Chryseobacterium ginsenosidimutans]|jgi:hypothetical protein|uniref:hypothetical protein n=1 Tax=Chryseobacterium ginsenosidimutans TaxID=687846 RepID=UPI00216993F4|nr:hypothetical protein [Chryseobacterium ginsenosidimutans]MCS3867927.1 hypothetical protein [Chryseobacterium ginsenosidimutans]
MKKSNLTKLSRQSLKDVFGGTLYPALECYSDRECAKYGEALIMCPNGTSSMTNYGCMGGKCMLNTGFCPPLEIEGPITLEP